LADNIARRHCWQKSGAEPHVVKKNLGYPQEMRNRPEIA
jgi:hypothetical protein